MQTVVVDIRANHDTGVARYGQSLLKALVPHLKDHGLRIVVVAGGAQIDHAHSAAALAPPGHVHVEVCPDHDGFVRRSRQVRDVIRASGADLFFTTHYLVDRECPAPFVVTIHDLTRLRFPGASYSDESFAARFGKEELALLEVELRALSAWDEPSHDGEERFHRYFRAVNRYLAENATRVLTVSAASADDLRTTLGVRRERISLIPAGVDTSIFHPRSSGVVTCVRRHYGITGPYCLFVGLTHPNKRFPWLVRSLLERRSALPRGMKLVAVGGHAERTPGIYELIADLRGHDFVVFTGRATDEELAALYTGASALLVASLNEGGSLPAIEALACGCEVVATDILPLRETLNGSAHFYQLNDADALANLTAAAITEQLVPRAPSFAPPTWEDAGARLAKVLKIALDERSSLCPTDGAMRS